MELEILKEIKKIKSEPADLKSFGKVVGCGFCVISLVLWRLEKDAWVWAVAIGITLLLLAFTVPAILKPFQKAWMTLALVMGMIMTPLILSILFFLVLTPMGVLMRLFGKDLLDLKIEKDRASYWKEVKKEEMPLEHYERQF